MSSTFTDATAFNADIGDWDVSQVTVMYRALAFFARFLRGFLDHGVKRRSDLNGAPSSFNRAGGA